MGYLAQAEAGDVGAIGGEAQIVLAPVVDQRDGAEIVWIVNGQRGFGGAAIGIGDKNVDFVFDVGNERAALGRRGNRQWRLADGDRFAARLRMSRGVLHSCLDECARCALAQRTPGEVGRQLEIEAIRAVGGWLARWT